MQFRAINTLFMSNRWHCFLQHDYFLFLGDNKYIMGDQISDVDCAAFGVIGSVYWASPSTDRGNAFLKSTEN